MKVRVGAVILRDGKPVVAYPNRGAISRRATNASST